MLHRHIKLTEFGIEPFGVGEGLQVGSAFRVLLSAIGNLGIGTCLDSFEAATARRIDASPVQLLAVPSMSPKLSAHEAVAKGRGLRGVASLVPCWFPPIGTDLDRRSGAWTPARPAGERAATEEASLTVEVIPPA